MERKIEYLKFEGHELRTLMYKKERWWIAKDICKLLKIKRIDFTKMKINTVDFYERSVLTERIKLMIVNKTGLEALIAMNQIEYLSKRFEIWLSEQNKIDQKRIKEAGYVARKG